MNISFELPTQRGLGLALMLLALTSGACTDDSRGAPSPGLPPLPTADAQGTLSDASTDLCTANGDGAACDDGDPCTQEETCSNGVCTGGVPTDCEDAGPCRPGVCDSDLGCVYTDLPDGSVCGVACFGEAACAAGECEPDPETEMQCPTPDEPCVAELRCHPATGSCTQSIYAPNGSSCDQDNDLCTLETCDGAGACLPTGEVETCTNASVEKPCWTHTCIPKDGTCIATLFIEGGSCNDNAPCTVNDTCIVTSLGQEACLGTPIDVDDDNPCTSDSCEGGVVIHEPIDGASCDTGDPCTPTGQCLEGTCVYEGCPCSPGVDGALACDDGNPCTDDDCVGDGECSHVPNDEPCDGGTCSDGACQESPDCEPIVYGSAGQGVDNGWTCDDVCASLDGTSVDWTGVDEQLAYCHSLVADPEDVVATPNNHSYPIYDRQNDVHMCKVNANGWKSTSNWAGGGTPEYGDRILCRCQVSDCPCTPGCAGLSCGVDACGTPCGDCAEGVACYDGACGCDGVPCGSSCCGDDEECVDGQCAAGASELVYSDITTGGVYHWSPATGSTQIGSCGQPWGLHFVPPDIVYVACIESDSVERITLGGDQVTVHTSDSAFFNARAITQGPTGAIYVASSTVTDTNVWEVNETTGTVNPYSTIGVMECGGIDFAADGALFWADFKEDGLVLKEPQGGGAETIIASFPGGYTLRDMQIGSDGRLYIVGATTAGGLRIHEQTGALVETLDLPGTGKGFGVARSATGEIYVLVDDTESGVYRRVGDDWELITPTVTGLGTVRVIP